MSVRPRKFWDQIETTSDRVAKFHSDRSKLNKARGSLIKITTKIFLAVG